MALACPIQTHAAFIQLGSPRFATSHFQAVMAGGFFMPLHVRPDVQIPLDRLQFVGLEKIKLNHNDLQ